MHSMIKKTTLVLLIVIALSVFIFKYKDASITKKLRKIPQDERKLLELFFRSAFAFDNFEYTLFGSKAVSVTGFYIPSQKICSADDLLDSIFCLYNPENLRIYRGWEIWKKYQHLFPMKNYAFIKSKNFIDNAYVVILLINKQTFLNTTRKHLNDFQAVLGKEITPELLLKQVLKSEDVFGDVLKNHQGLIGTLLGYGRNNAWLFHRREEMIASSGGMSCLLGKVPPFLKLRPSREELEVLDQALKSFDDRGILSFNSLLIGLPNFVADLETTETAFLKREYEKQYHEIVHKYQKGDFLEITLRQISQ